MQNTYNMDTGQLPAMSPSNCWSKCLAAHLLIFVIQPSSSVKFLGFKLRLCKKIQISGVPGSPPFPCLPEIELLDQVFLDFGGSRGGRWPSSYQTIIYECHSVPHKTALWCVRYSARYQLWDLREGFWKKPDQRQNVDHQHKICNLRKKNGSPTCATCFPTSSFWCMFTSFPSHFRFWELCPYTLKLSAPCICWNVLGY